MERKIGEIFEYNGEWYQCLKSKGACSGCIAFGKNYSFCRSFGECAGDTIFNKLEKVGKPYEFDGHIFQSYRTFEVPIFTENYATVREFGNNSKISIEIKQNKEDMEEKKIQHYDCFFDRKQSNLNLKPFDLEAAKAGNPVCTRDGRKARIICFDRIDSTGCNLPIVVLVQCEETEVLQLYHDDGKCDVKADLDLMMLPEKKEGWAKVRKDINLYDTKEEADRKMIGNDEYVTAKVCWEE